jgi:hypothetical protein
MSSLDHVYPCTIVLFNKLEPSKMSKLRKTRKITGTYNEIGILPQVRFRPIVSAKKKLAVLKTKTALQTARIH